MKLYEIQIHLNHTKYIVGVL